MDVLRGIRAVLMVPVLMACLPAPALAQDSGSYLQRLRGADVPLPEAQFLLYQYMAGSGDSGPDERLQADVRSRLDIGNARFYALLDHMRATVEASREFTDAQNRQVCSRRDKLDTVKALGDALNASMAAVRERQAALMEEAKQILGPAGLPKFVALLEELRDRMTVSRVDYTALLVEQKIEVSVALEEICRQASEAAGEAKAAPAAGESR